MKETDLSLETIFTKNKKYCFLVGSGISIDPPSNLPAGYQMTKGLIQELVPEEELETVLNHTDPDRNDIRDSNDFIRFEQLMGYAKSLDADTGILKLYSDCVQPNTNHCFLAHMITKGHFVLTTNFDSLIEYGLLRIGVPKNKVFPVIEWYEWGYAIEEDQYYVFKLHGSVYDVRSDKESIESVQHSLDDISKRKTGSLELESWKRIRIEPILQNHDVVVLGYSGLDDFDIIPTLKAIQTAKRIIWINHDSELSLTEMKIERVNLEHDTSEHKTSRLDSFLFEIVRLEARQLENVIKISVNARYLVDWLCHRFKVGKMVENRINKGDQNYKFHMDLKRNLPEMQKWFIAGNIYHDLKYFERARGCFERAASLERENSLRGWILERLFRISSELKKNEEAREIWIEAFDWAVKKKDAVLNASLRVGLGENIANVTPKKGLEVLEDVYKYYDTENDTSGKCLSLIAQGKCWRALKDSEKALEKYRTALSMAEYIGDLKSKARCHCEIGRLHSKDEKYDRAKSHFDKSLFIYSQIGDIRKKMDMVHYLGIICRKSHDYESAVKYYETGLDLALEISDCEAQATALNNLALVSRKLKDFAKSKEYHHRALQMFWDIDDYDGLARSYTNLGTLYYEIGEYEKTLVYYRKALKWFTEAGNDENIKSLKVNIGHVESLLDKR